MTSPMASCRGSHFHHTPNGAGTLAGNFGPMLEAWGVKTMEEMLAIPSMVNSKGGLKFADWMRFMSVVPKWSVKIDDVRGGARG